MAEIKETMDDFKKELEESYKEADGTLGWERLREAQASKKVYTGKVGGVVKGGVVIYVEGIRGFMPASRLALSYVEDTNVYLDQEIEFIVAEVNEADKKLILSAREVLKQKAREEKNRRISKFAVGTVLEGTVEQLKDYGAFVNLGDGVSGLLHISQISDKRLKHPNQVLNEGDVVKVKITKNADNKISLSMKAAAEVAEKEEAEDDIPEYKETGRAFTSFAALLKDIKLK